MKRFAAGLLALGGAGLLLAGLMSLAGLLSDLDAIWGAVLFVGPVMALGFGAFVGGLAVALGDSSSPGRRFVGSLVLACAALAIALSGVCAATAIYQDMTRPPQRQYEFRIDAISVLLICAVPWAMAAGLWLFGRRLAKRR